MNSQNKRQTDNFLIQGSILAATSILVRIIGLVYRVPMVRILGNEGIGYYGYAFEIYIKIDGKPSYPAICVLVGGLTNLVLDYVFVVIFHYGVTGAAIATGISQVTSCTMLLFYIILKAKYVKFIKLNKINFEKISKIFKTGFSEFLTEISSGILILIYNLVILKKIGVLGVSIFGTVSYITSFITMTMIGFSQGIQPVISYNLGKKHYKNLKDILN